MVALTTESATKKWGKYPFPAFDFIFQNSGSGTAVIWKFCVHILESEIDDRPELKFGARVEAGELRLSLRDDGWGPGREIEVQFGEQRLNQLFPVDRRRFLGSVAGGDDRNILTVSVLPRDVDVIRETAAKLEPPAKRGLDRSPLYDAYFERRELPQDTIEISNDAGQSLYEPEIGSREWLMGSLVAQWKSIDGKFAGQSYVSHPYTRIGLTPSGFVQTRPDYPCGAALHSDTIYAAIIEPSLGRHVREYAISRSVAPGEVDRFHVMLGATKSAFLKARVDFYVDDAVVTAENTFELRIWNPRNRAFHEDFRDGEERHQYM